MNAERPPGPGWTSLALAFAHAGLPAPPVPDAFKPKLLATQPWCWSTRPDIDPVEMYSFRRYIDEALGDAGAVDLAAVSHAGHGVNSYSLNFQLVSGAIGVVAQHGWGGAYSDVVSDKQEVAYTYAVLEEILSTLRDNLPEELAAVICLSRFRGVCSLWLRRDLVPEPAELAHLVNGSDDDRPSSIGPWRESRFGCERGLLAYAAAALGGEQDDWFDEAVADAEGQAR